MKTTDLKENVIYYYKTRDIEGFTSIKEIKFDKLTKCYGIIEKFNNGKLRETPLKYKLYYDKDGEVCINTSCGKRRLLEKETTLDEKEMLYNKECIINGMLGLGKTMEEINENVKKC